MNSLDAVTVVLEEAEQPLHYSELTQQILDRGLWSTTGKTPQATISANLGKDIKKYGDQSRFVRVAAGTYGLRKWELSAAKQGATDSSEKDKKPEQKLNGNQKKALTFSDAAEYVLAQRDNRQPMHYRNITEEMLAQNLIQTDGLTPEATLYAQILTEIKRQIKRGETPRFVRHGKGYIGLRKWMGEGLVFQIRQHNNEIRKKLLAQLKKITPAEFEELVAQLLVAIGFEEVMLTPLQGDKGIDVRGVLVVGNVVRIRMAVQAKRWRKNVRASIVQQVRGSLGTHDQGLIITTSDFSKGAYKEAARPDAIPVALMNGKQLVELMIEHEINVRRMDYQLIELDDTDSKGT